MTKMQECDDDINDEHDDENERKLLINGKKGCLFKKAPLLLNLHP